MKSHLAAVLLLGTSLSAQAGQAPFAAPAPNIPVSSKDRFYTSDQFSNTVSVIDPAANKLLGVIRLGDTTPANLSPLYKGQALVHGMCFSPDRKTLAVVSIGSNSVTLIDGAPRSTNCPATSTCSTRRPEPPPSLKHERLASPVNESGRGNA